VDNGTRARIETPCRAVWVNQLLSLALDLVVPVHLLPLLPSSGRVARHHQQHWKQRVATQAAVIALCLKGAVSVTRDAHPELPPPSLPPAAGTYTAPAEGSTEQHLQHIRALPAEALPQVFGLHPNASIAFQMAETRKILDCVLAVQPQVSGAASESACLAPQQRSQPALLLLHLVRGCSHDIARHAAAMQSVAQSTAPARLPAWDHCLQRVVVFSAGLRSAHPSAHKRACVQRSTDGCPSTAGC
jgi:hypothetical protein